LISPEPLLFGFLGNLRWGEPIGVLPLPQRVPEVSHSAQYFERK
jgi:hypothetical protein